MTSQPETAGWPGLTPRREGPVMAARIRDLADRTG
jgi:hypothetical protein